MTPLSNSQSCVLALLQTATQAASPVAIPNRQRHLPGGPRDWLRQSGRSRQKQPHMPAGPRHPRLSGTNQTLPPGKLPRGFPRDQNYPQCSRYLQNGQASCASVLYTGKNAPLLTDRNVPLQHAPCGRRGWSHFRGLRRENRDSPRPPMAVTVHVMYHREATTYLEEPEVFAARPDRRESWTGNCLGHPTGPSCNRRRRNGRRNGGNNEEHKLVAQVTNQVGHAPRRGSICRRRNMRFSCTRRARAKPANVPQGVVKSCSFSKSAIFPGTVRSVAVFIPAQYDGSKPACVYVKTDGYNPVEKALWKR